ncbi:MAG: hypothetical protein V8R01_02755 [Bacilli bacterium]
MKQEIVIAGFAGIGKTTLAKNIKMLLNLESSNYRWDNSKIMDIPVEQRKGTIRNSNPNWPLNYINAIEEAIEKYDIVLVWIKPEVLEIYEKNNIPYVLCYSFKKALPEYEQRFIKRGNNKEYIRRVIDTYDERFEQFENYQADKIVLEEKETLEDYLVKNNYPLEK